MASASRPRTPRSPRSGSKSGNAAGPGGAGSETPTGVASAPGPRPVLAAEAKKPAVKRPTRRVDGEALVPVPARKKYPKARTGVPRPAKRVPLINGPVINGPLVEASASIAEVGTAPASFNFDDATGHIWHDLQPTQSPSLPAALWLEIKRWVRAQVLRLQPQRVLLDQATARYHQLLADQSATRHSV